MNKLWYIIPRLMLDREKYRGKGRPRKTDYRIFPQERDLFKVKDTRFYVDVKEAENWVYSTGT